MDRLAAVVSSESVMVTRLGAGPLVAPTPLSCSPLASSDNTAVGRRNLSILLLLALAALALPALGQTHVPSEQELKRKLGQPTGEEPGRGYQRDSVEGFGTKATRAATWVKDHLSTLHITPPRLMLGLGVLGILIGWNKNKKKVGWAVLAGFSFLLVLLGTAAMIFRW